MQQSPSWEANRSSANQEILHISWNSEVHYCIHNRLPLVHIPSQINPPHAPPTHFLKIPLILSSLLHLGIPNDLLPSGFTNKTLYAPLPSSTHAPFQYTYKFDVHRAVYHNIIPTVKPTRCTNVSNLFYFGMALHVSDGLSVHHHDFKTVHTATGICQTDTAVCLLASRQQYLFAVCTVLNSWWWTERPSETCSAIPK